MSNNFLKDLGNRWEFANWTYNYIKQWDLRMVFNRGKTMAVLNLSGLQPDERGLTETIQRALGSGKW